MTQGDGPQVAARGVPAIQLVAVAIFVCFILAQGISAPFQNDAEPQSAEWIVSVVRDGNWFNPRDYYGFLDRKPPLYYWLSALASKATGGTVDETRARVVSVAAATVIAVEVLAWTASEIGLAEGWLALLFILGIYGFCSRASLALTDMLMAALLMSAWLVAYPIFGGGASRARICAAGGLLGLGIVTKGPVVLILAVFAGLLFVAFERGRTRPLMRSAWPWQIVAIAATVGAIWYTPWLVIGGPHEVRIFLHENFGHFAPASLGGTGEASRPFWYITARLIGGANPLILLMPATLAGFATGEVSTRQRKPLVFQASLVAAVVIFFSVASAKRDDYILPALPGVAILSAAAFGMREPTGGYPGGAKIRDGVSALIGFAALLAVALALATARNNPQPTLQSSDAALMAILERGIATWSLPFMIFLGIAAVAAVAALVFLVRRSTILVGAMIGVISLAGVVLIDTFVRPELARTRSYKTFIAQIRERIDGHPLFVVHDADFELAFYYGALVPPLLFKKSLPPAIRNEPAAPSEGYLIAQDRDLNMLPNSYRQRIRLIERSKISGGEGPPALYVIEPTRPGLKSEGGMGR
jgi:4-amino-4-deoxy-L-arabinose transferase-like glycosyltransferase